MKEHKTGGACSTHMEIETYKEFGCLEDLGVDGRRILEISLITERESELR
jgi:hypothetical protein